MKFQKRIKELEDHMEEQKAIDMAWACAVLLFFLVLSARVFL